MTSARAAYDEVARTYQGPARGAFGALYDHLTARTLARVLPPPGALVLDAGGGTGRHAVALARAGHRVVVVDPSRGMLDVARAAAGGLPSPMRPRLALGTLERMALRDASFDFVLCEGDPLSYCGDAADDAARELMRVLRPGGGFYVSCDSQWSGALLLLAAGAASEGLDCAARGASFDPYGVPVRAFTPQGLRALLERAGAEDVRVEGKVSLAHLLPDAALDALWADPRSAAALRDVEERLSRDDSTVGLASHLVATGRKGAR